MGSRQATRDAHEAAGKYYKAAEDFLGTMELARNAIGLLLYGFEHRKPDNILDDIEPFWEHSAGAALWLNIAADRIREYYVTARFGVPPEELWLPRNTPTTSGNHSMPLSQTKHRTLKKLRLICVAMPRSWRNGEKHAEHDCA